MDLLKCLVRYASVFVLIALFGDENWHAPKHIGADALRARRAMHRSKRPAPTSVSAPGSRVLAAAVALTV